MMGCCDVADESATVPNAFLVLLLFYYGREKQDEDTLDKRPYDYSYI